MRDYIGALGPDRRTDLLTVTTNILILAHQSDVHAAAVRWGLGCRGIHPVFWPAGTFPAKLTLSIDVSSAGLGHAIGSADRSVSLNDVGVVWNRRQGKPLLSPSTDPRDRDFIEEQSRQHLRSFLGTACKTALWVNSPPAAALEVDKARQLDQARVLGMAIPATLISNDPNKIVDFYWRHAGAIVHKTYKLGAWNESSAAKGALVNYTAPVEPHHLDDPSVLALCPGIFQQVIDKSFEVRVTVIGHSIFAVRLDIDGQIPGSIDWRAQPTRPPRLTVHSLPASVAADCLRYMAHAGLVFACFDFLVDRTGAYIFLEVNQMGQFLWIEEQLPDLPLLDAMCGLLESGDPTYVWQERPKRLRFVEFLEQHNKARGNHATR